MPDVKGPTVTLGFDTIMIALAVVLAAMGVLVAIVKGIEAWKKISLRDRVAKLEQRMDKVDDRLEAGKRRFKSQSDDMGQILMTLHNLQLHFITGNDHELLKESNEKLTAYMNARAVRDAEEI